MEGRVVGAEVGVSDGEGNFAPPTHPSSSSVLLSFLFLDPPLSSYSPILFIRAFLHSPSRRTNRRVRCVTPTITNYLLTFLNRAAVKWVALTGTTFNVVDRISTK